MSPRAACRLETLGFTAVYDYSAGKADWLAAGLATEGPGAAVPRPGTLARSSVPTCTPDSTISTARERAQASREDSCVVVCEAGVVLGVLDPSALAGEQQALAADVMRAGPTTVRAHEDLGDLLTRMHARGVTSILVTDPDGRLLGLLHRDDADAIPRAERRS
jgi:CBS domain-containing protein